MKIELTERAFIPMLHSPNHYAQHLNEDEETRARAEKTQRTFGGCGTS